VDILYLANFTNRHTPEAYTAHALRQEGHKVTEVCVRTKPLSRDVVACRRWDLILTGKPSDRVMCDLDPKDFAWIRDYGPLVMWLYDYRTPFPPAWLECAKLCSYTFFNSPQNVRYVRENGGRSAFLTQGADARYHHYEKGTIKHPLVFVGTQTEQRREIFKELKKEYGLVSYGPCEYADHRGTFYGHSLRKIYAQSLVTVHPARYKSWNLWGCWSNRLWSSQACGLVCIVDYWPSNPKDFRRDLQK